MKRSEIDQIIHNALYCQLACSLNNEPYIIPIAYGYDGEAIYFHTGMEGKKIDVFSANPKVCLSFIVDVKIHPNPLEACQWSFQYKSVIGYGDVKEINNLNQRLNALSAIMAHYTQKQWDFPEDELSKTRLWKVKLHDLTGKVSTGE